MGIFFGVGYNGIRPIFDGITGVLILFVVVGLPVVGWLCYKVQYHCIHCF